MNKYLVLSAALLTSAAFAKQSDEGLPWQEKWQVWGGIGAGFLGASEADLDQRLTDANITDGDASNVPVASFGNHFGLDLMFLPWIGAQYSYVNMGEITADLTGLPSGDLIDFYQGLAEVHPVSTKGHKLALLGQWAITDNTNLYGNLGVLYYHSYYSSTVPQGSSNAGLVLTNEKSGFAPVAGLRLDQGWTDRWFAYGEVQGAYVDENIRLLGTVGIGYRIVNKTEVVECQCQVPMLAMDDSYQINALEQVQTLVRLNDQEISNNAELVVSVQPKLGVLAQSGNGLTYQHTTNSVESDQFHYYWVDENGQKSNTAVVTININDIDSDKDGVFDSQDRCPATPTKLKVDDRGCPISAREELSIRLDVLFANNSAEIGPEFYPEIKRVADFMLEHDVTNLVIEGHTSTAGSASYNLKLSQQRAEAVMAVLIAQFNVPAEYLTAKGFGESMPIIAVEQNKEEQAINRRVEAVVQNVVKEVQIER